MDEMIVETGRRVVATLPAGTPLIAAIDALCTRHEITQGEVRLRGALRDVRLALGDEVEPLFISGTVQVVAAEGDLAPDLGVTGFSAVLSWLDRGLPRVVAGFVEEAESAGVRVVVEGWDAVQRVTAGPRRAAPKPADSRAEAPRSAETARPDARPAPDRRESLPNTAAPTVRSPSEATRAPNASAPHPSASPPPPAPIAPPAESSGGWAAAVAASRAPPTATARPGGSGLSPSGAGPLDEDPEAKAGDVLVHPQFGRCKVVGGTDGERVKIRMATGRFVDLHLGYVRLIRQADEDGVRVFRVQPVKR